MAGLGILLAGISGAGKGLGSSIEADREAERRQELMREQSRLEEEKTLRIDEARRAATRAAGVQQGQEISAGAGLLQSQRNQSDADRINADNANVIGGSNMMAADAATLRNAPPEARKAYGLLASTRQSDLEDRATAAENLGYLDAAKETRGQLQTEVQDQRYQQQSTDNNRRMDRQELKDDEDRKFRQQHEMRMARVSEAGVAHQQQMMEFEKSRMTKMDADSKRAFTSKALDGANEYARELTKTMSSSDFGLLPDAEKADIKARLKDVRTEQERLRTALAGAGVEGSTPPPKAFNPDDYRIGKSNGGNGSSVQTVTNPIAQPQQTDAKKEGAPPPRTAAQIRGKIETRPAGRGSSKLQYQNPKTGEWVNSIEEASKGL